MGLDKTKPGIKYFRANSTGEDAAAAGEDAVAIGVERAKANEQKILWLWAMMLVLLHLLKTVLPLAGKAVSGSF